MSLIVSTTYYEKGKHLSYCGKNCALQHMQTILEWSDSFLMAEVFSDPWINDSSERNLCLSCSDLLLCSFFWNQY
jgi:hypothetical protein